MTDNPQDEADLAAQAAKLKAILESALDAIITIDSSGRITTVNSAAEEVFGYTEDEFLGRNVHFLMPEPYHSEHDQYIQNYLETGERKIIGIGREVTGRRKNGSTFPMHLAVSEFEIDGERHFTGIIKDLTSQKETERQLRQAQKIEAMGQLTGGIAHDFNNLLTVIIGNLEMLEGRLTDEMGKELAGEALEAAELGGRLTARLLAFARRSHLEPEVVNLNSFVLDLTEMLHRTLGETIMLSNALSPELWTARVDASQVESAIVNLAVNARDAMPDGGRLVLETANVRIDTDTDNGVGELRPGDYVRLSVSDTGTGMDRPTRERAFEPFFTTKEAGRGTGLGLSMVYGFAVQSGGHASIYSEPDKGTTVNLYLPRHKTGATSGVEEISDVTAARGRGERILVVEDDERVRRLTLTRLIDLGYDVVEAADGNAALEILADNKDFDLLFTDLVMPGGVSGYELAKRARAMLPMLKVLLTSGYAEELTHTDQLVAENLKLLRKPYRQVELAAAIESALNTS